MTQFPSDDIGTKDLISRRDIILESDSDMDGAGDIIFRTGGVERARINAAGVGSGWPNVLGGSISARPGIIWTFTRQNGEAAASNPIDLQGFVYSTDAASGTTSVYTGLTSEVTYGDSAGGIAAVGTAHAATLTHTVANSATANNEHAALYARLRYDNGSIGRAWLCDLNLHGSIATQQSLLAGMHLFVNNYFNGDPTSDSSHGLYVVTLPGAGGGADAAHLAATTYPNVVGIQVLGMSSTTAQGWKTGILVGGTGSGWNVAASRIGTGVHVRDYDTFGLLIDNRYAGAAAPAIAVDAANGPVLIGETAAAFAASMLEVKGPGANTDPTVYVGNSGANFDYVIALRNSAANYKWFINGASANHFLIGAAAGDGGLAVGTAAKRFHLGGTNSVLSVGNDNTLAFFQGAGALKQAVIGSRGANAALASLITALAAYGLVTDSSTA